jgi:hypothetical protein
MRQHSARRIKKQKKTRELAGSSQKKITKIGRNKFSLFWKAMDKNLCKQKEKKKNRRQKLDLQDSAEIAEI